MSEVSKGKKWRVNPFQTLEVQEMEYTYSSTNLRNYEKKKIGVIKEQNLHKFVLRWYSEMFIGETFSFSFPIFFLAWDVMESLLHKEESLLIFSAKKLICIGEKSVPQMACLSSEVKKYTAELSFGSSRNTLSQRAQMSTEICTRCLQNKIDDVPSQLV